MNQPSYLPESPERDAEHLEIERLKEERAVLDARHRALDICTRFQEECHGIFFEMTKIEERIHEIDERLIQLEK